MCQKEFTIRENCLFFDFIARYWQLQIISACKYYCQDTQIVNILALIS